MGLAAAKSLRGGFRFPTSSLKTLELEPWVSLWSNHCGEDTRLGLGYLGLAVGKSQVEEPTPPFCIKYIAAVDSRRIVDEYLGAYRG